MTVDEIVQRVRERSRRLASGLPVPQPPLGSDFSLNGVVPVPETFRPAAVLVPLVRREPGIKVVAAARAEAGGIHVVMDRCIMIEHRHLTYR